ncbi:YicC/YloC family endoribonuclease [Trichloromonas sp.]|uniref:YicC/YloC family endoribonuclease n=1 Tax=Trichloromonas sp. TaxID=3069249 RepID=UPI003D818236
MVASMTGYGKGQAEVEGIALAVEIKTVNHRYGDVTVKSPRFLFPYENDIKKRVAEVLKRGKIDVFVSQDASSEKGMVPALNRPLAAAYVEVFEEMRGAFGLSGDVPMALLAAQKDVITIREGELNESALLSCLDQALGQALEAVRQMRCAEGEATLRDMQTRIDLLEEMLVGVELRAPQVASEWRDKLEARLAKLQKDFDYEPQRVAQEIAIFADRCDISEEVTRFKSHLVQFRGLFVQAEPIGRQMDFLVQELNREVNTMGSKSNDADLTRVVVSMKAELEKIREQVQNIE